MVPYFLYTLFARRNREGSNAQLVNALNFVALLAQMVNHTHFQAQSHGFQSCPYHLGCYLGALVAQVANYIILITHNNNAYDTIIILYVPLSGLEILTLYSAYFLFP